MRRHGQKLTLPILNLNWTPDKQLTGTLGYFKPWITLQELDELERLPAPGAPEHR